MKSLVHRKTRRTTLTLEADVADFLDKKLAQDRRLNEKDLVNDLIRKGTSVDADEKRSPFEIKPFKTKLAASVTVEQLDEMIREI